MRNKRFVGLHNATFQARVITNGYKPNESNTLACSMKCENACELLRRNVLLWKQIRAGTETVQCASPYIRPVGISDG